MGWISYEIALTNGAHSLQGSRHVPVADMNTILKERDACGVGIIANLANDASHKVVEKALTALGCMEHRGGCSADDDSGDGAGIMVQVPWKILEAWASAEGKEFDQHKTGLAQVFLPNDEAAAAASKKVMEQVRLIFCSQHEILVSNYIIRMALVSCMHTFTVPVLLQVLEGEGFRLVGWRVVPVNLDVVGKFAKATQPIIEQAIVESTTNLKEDELERALYMVRKLIEAKGKTDLDSKFSQDFYICSMSSRTIVYKGMLRSVVVGQFYLDLKDTAFESAFAIYHRRFSTNTTPKWPLAQPMRILGHNGEINTLQGNLNWAASREANMTHPVWNGRESELRPITDDAVSDSANLDRVAELLVRCVISQSYVSIVLHLIWHTSQHCTAPKRLGALFGISSVLCSSSVLIVTRFPGHSATDMSPV